MEKSIVASLVMLALQSGAPQQSQPADNGEYRLRIEGCADLTHLGIATYITGSFGGYGEFGAQRGVRDYTLSLSHNGQRADSLKVIIICPGQRTTVLDEQAPFPQPPAVRTRRLEPLGLLPLSGRVAAKSLRPGLLVEARYQAYWAHAFFGMTDGFVSSFNVASSPVGTDGAFALHLPDFARDPVVESYPLEIRGVFVLSVRELATGNLVDGARVELPIASQYSPVVIGASRSAAAEGGQ